MIRICIDAGHKKDYKAYNTDPIKYEGNQMYYLSLYEKQELEKYEGVTVTLTRSVLTDDPSLTERGKLASNYDLLLSNHSNANSNESITGVLCYMDCTETNGTLADALGKAVARQLSCDYLGKRYWIQTYKDGELTDNGAVYETPQKGTSNWLTVLNSAKRHNCKLAFLMEQGYHTNPANAKLLGDNTFLKKLAKIKADIIADYFDLNLKEDGGEGNGNGEYEEYIVKKGDTLIKIAQKYHTTAAILAKLNALEDSNLILIGQKLLVPSLSGSYVPEVGDRVLVNGLLYSNANGGNTIEKKDANMYIVEIISGKYRYPIALAKKEGGSRQGWGALDSISKA